MRSALFLAGELARWLAGEPIQSRRVTTRERVKKWMRRHPYRMAAGTARVLSILAGSIASFVLWRRAEASRFVAVQSVSAERRSGYAALLASALAGHRAGAAAV